MQGCLFLLFFGTFFSSFSRVAFFLYRRKLYRIMHGMEAISIRTSNIHEIEACRQLEKAGYDVIKNGWPDFIAVKGDRILLIEVKKPTNRSGLSPRQRKVAAIFKKFFGINVHVVRPGDKLLIPFRTRR